MRALIPVAPAAHMRIQIVTPARPGSRHGNRVTALRWAGLLRALGHEVRIVTEYDFGRPDLLIALHARKSAVSIRRFRNEHPDRPLIVALTGTDAYEELPLSAEARESLELADRIVTLQPLACEQVPERLRSKCRAIFQSADSPRTIPPPLKGVFELAVVGHLREVKDPFLSAAAARSLPSDSRVRITHVGGALTVDMEARARKEQEENPRYRWVGELPRWKSLRILARSRALVLTSRLEGGANVVSEAIACGVPVLSTRIDGSIGVLGADYPGLFDGGDTRGLAQLMRRVETCPAFLRELTDW